MDKLKFKKAQREDVATVLQFIREIAEYEKMEKDVIATEATLTE